MMEAAAVPPHPAPLARWHAGEVYADAVRTKTGAYDLGAVVGVRWGSPEVPVGRIARDVAWAVGFSLGWSAFFGAAPIVFAASLLGAVVGWWWAEQKRTVILYLSGGRVELGEMDEGTAIRIAGAIHHAASARR